jgi:broad specificity phosphatase PhoE
VIDGLARASTTVADAERAAAVPGSPAPAAASFYDPHAGPRTLLVGHDGAFKVALLALLGLPLDRFWTFTQTTTGIAVLDIRNGRTVLRAWNRTEHLAPLEIEAGEAERRAEDEAAARSRSGAL